MSHLAFDSPGYLILLAALPFFWWASYRSLSGLGRVRRLLAIGLRSLVYTLLVAALADAQWVRISQRLTVFYLLDQSLSVSQQQSDAMVKYINESIRAQRDRRSGDRAGVIVFGREGAIEIPPLDEDQQIPRVETYVDREHSNLADALKLAQASFPHDSAKRIVIITDGNQTIGDALKQAHELSAAGIGIDVVPIRSPALGEVAVEKVILPPELRRGQPFDLRVVLNNTTGAGQDPKPVEGRLQIVRKSGDREQMLTDQPITLEPGRQRLSIREELNASDAYTYEARFLPSNPADDAMPQNNQASAFTHIRGSGQVLILEDHENRGEFDFLAERLRAVNLEVTLRSTRPDELFTNLNQLQPFDTIVLGNIPREHLSDEQIDMLVRNTQHLGSGLVMIGGPNSFGAGGWTNTPIEEAMPVDFQIKNAKVKPIGALAMIMHATEIPQGNHWQTLIGQESINTLGDEDYAGVIHFTGRADWLWSGGMKRVGVNRRNMMAMLDRMTPGDMPDFEPTLILAHDGFAQLTESSVKHAILISDGDPGAPNYGPSGAIAGLKRMNVKVSTVAIGAHGPAGHATLQQIATATGGRYYVVNNAATLPRIYQREVRQVARPLVFERDAGFQPQVVIDHEVLQGIERQLPPITGYVLTTPKQNSLAEILVVSPMPADNPINPILASWTYGLGKTAVLTTDAGKRWATSWTAWPDYDKFFSQLMRWSMRPSGDTGNFSLSTDVRDGKGRVVITALDKDDRFLNFLTPSASIVGPDMKPVELAVKQVAPGRYVGEFDAAKTGSYLVLVSPGAGQIPLRSGVSVPYSDEFRQRETNEALLESMAESVPSGGEAGRLMNAPADLDSAARLAKLLETDPFRHDLVRADSSQSIWHLLVLTAAALFFGDVFVRRVSINFDWLPPLVAKARDRLLRRDRQAAAPPTIERLRSRKAEVSDELEQRKAAMRFEAIDAEKDVLNPAELLSESLATAAEPKRRPVSAAAAEQEPESYTARLLKAKQQARTGMKRDDADPSHTESK